jgi:HEAT repeat protein
VTGKPRDRVEAVEAARRIGAGGAALVLGALKDEDAAVRREALEGLALIGKVPWTAEQIARLREIAARDDAQQKLNACLALHESDPDARAFVETQIDDLRRMIAKGTVQGEWLAWLEAWLAPAIVPKPPRLNLKVLGSEDDHARRHELRKIREVGGGFKEHEDAIAALLPSENPAISRDAAIALEYIGANAIQRVLKHGSAQAAYVCKNPTPDDVNAIVARIDQDPPDEELAVWMLVLGRAGHLDDRVIELLTYGTKSTDARVRANSVWSLGQLGLGVPGALGDRSPAVREMAMPYVKSLPRLRDILLGMHREARILAARRLGQLQQTDALLALAAHPDPLLRMTVAQALGPRCPEALARDPERDVRIAAATSLRGPVLRTMLKDSNWRVRAAAIRSMGRARIGTDDLVPLLASRNYAISMAAYESLRQIGAPAASAIARAVGHGNEATWHYAPKLFGALGAAGVGGVAPLVAALKHSNPTAREAAARCLGAIGPPASAATPALIASLSDRRLSVIAHASLALGHIGVSEPLIAATTDKHTRTRAYAAFALGWALGAKRNFDQAFFEPRPPVLDCGAPEPDVTRAQAAALSKMPELERRRLARKGLRSKDPAIAVPCAVELDYDMMNAWECERAVELVIADGFRKGNPFDFSCFRSYVGSNEVPACIQIMSYARDCSPPRSSIYGDLHRSARADTIPALLWFDRNEDAIRLDGISELHQPLGNSAQYRALRSRGDIWKHIERVGGLWEPQTWWLDTEPIPESREGALIALAEVLDQVFERFSGEWPSSQRWGALRAMGRATGETSMRYLRRVAQEDSMDGLLALASLTQRGDPAALVRLLNLSREHDELLPLLLDVRPKLGVAVCRERLSDTTSVADCVQSLGTMIDMLDATVGVRWNPDRIIGIEPAIPVELFGVEILEQIVRHVPGANTKRVAGALLRRMEAVGNSSSDLDDGEERLGRLAFSDSGKVRALLRRASEGEDPGSALELLARLQHPDDEARIVNWIADDPKAAELVGAWCSPAIAAAVRKKAQGAEVSIDGGLCMTQCGFDLDLRVLERAPEEDDESEETTIHAANPKDAGKQEVREFKVALAAGRGQVAAQALLKRHPQLHWWYLGDVGPRWPWMKAALQQRYAAREHGEMQVVLCELATWDAGARSEYWSIMRAGRYRWINDCQESHGMTLGFDFATLPFWAEELESNCCRINPRIDVMFRKLFGIDDLNDCTRYGIGQPPSRRVRSWFELYGGDLRWSKLARQFLPVPE